MPPMRFRCRHAALRALEEMLKWFDGFDDRRNDHSDNRDDYDGHPGY